MHAVVFRHKFRFILAAALLIASAPLVFFPWSPVATNWYGWIALGLLAGGFSYLMLTGELGRVLFEPEVWRASRTLVVGGWMAALVGFLPGAVHAWGHLLFDFEYPGQALVISTGATIAGIGVIIGSVGFLMEWKTLPKLVDESATKALTKMKESGFGIDDSNLWIGIDSGIAEGWSYPAGDESVILLSPSSVYSRESVGLFQTLIKEMSHIYLTQTKHASHLVKTYDENLRQITKDFPDAWQLKILRDAVAFPWEAYAEDLTFKVLEDSKTRWAKRTIEFFGLADATARSIAISKRHRMWGNALILLRNCYLAAEMERHDMPDPEGIVKNANHKLLSKLSPEAIPFFDNFHQLFVGLRDDITAEGYQKMLANYLSKFVALAELGNTNPATTRIDAQF